MEATVIECGPAAQSEVSMEAWKTGLAHLEERKAEVEKFAPIVDRVDSAYWRLRDRVKHVSVSYPGGRSVSTADGFAVRSARRNRDEARFIEAAALPCHRADVALADAADARDARLAAIDARLAMSVANNFYDRLVDRMCEAELALLRMPAPNGHAAMWKVERLWAIGDTIWNDDREVQVHADLRALLIGGRD